MSFKVNFDILDYGDIYPDPPENITDVINHEYWVKKDYDNCFWRKQPIPKEITLEYKEKEVRRIIRTGVWVFVKDQMVWLPGNYYFFLQYFNTGGDAPEFRLKMLKYIYFKLRARKNKKCIGTMVVKQRQEGLTTIEMSNALHEMSIGLMDFGQIGIQSKSRDTVKLSCWRTLKMGWQMIPRWLKDILFWDIANDGKIEETIKFIHPADDHDKGRDILISFGASVHNAFDSFNNMRSCIFDEWTKWTECSLYRTFLNYKKFIVPGGQRKGLFTMISSPSDTNGKHSDEAYQLWEQSEYNEETGTSESGLFRYYMSPLEGIDGYYDKFGDADGEVILAKILKDRASVVEEFRLSEIRAFPLNKKEMFESSEDGKVWDNYEGIKERSIYLLSTRFKDDITKEPKGVYGNLEWDKGREDTEVYFRASDLQKFDNVHAKFFLAYHPKDRVPLKDTFTPPRIITNVLGIDPYNMRHPKGKNPSKGAGTNYKFMDLGDGVTDTPTMLYLARPHNEKIFYEDMIMAAVFNRAMIQYENNTPGISEYITDRGYHAWLLASIGEKQGSVFTGDAPRGGGKNALLDKMLLLINAFTNKPINPDDKCLLENVWIQELIDDLLDFNPIDTHKNDCVMSFGQAIIGAGKLLKRKQKNNPSEFNTRAISYLLD